MRLPCFAMEKTEVFMNQIISYLIIGILAIVGGGPTLYLLVSLPAVIIWKIYRKVKYGYKITD